ncbi:GD25958 [Drosophila simulans]|uniref:GD25958 n=1 Tax=Drosophila simulans TaxID=7240 RepID=B4QAM8_DROSI|nr:GD25958 [Drosophila simulans]
MMGVSQNMELKELSTEEALMRTLSSELGNEVESHSTPAILNESSRTSVDEVDLCELTNGVDSSDNVKVIDKPKKISDQERNPGSDLDALLDKISSIVDCSPKNSDDIDLLDRGEECDSVSAKKRTAGDTDKNLKEQKEKPEEEEQGEDVLSSLEGAECIDPDSELKTEEKLEENEEHASSKESTQKTEDLADSEGDEPMLVGDEVTEKSKESIPIQSEESMEIDEPDESKESEELQGQKEKEEPGYCKKAKDSEEAKDKEKPEMKTIQASKRADILGDTKGKEDPNPSQDVEDVKDTEEPENKKEIEQTGELEEPVVIEGEETEDPKKKVQKEFDARTQAQEMKYTTIDDLLVEAVRKVVGIEEKKVAEDEPEGEQDPRQMEYAKFY